ncbi:MAG: aminoacylase [Rhodospirillaceae bacterium]|nr:aminoacylase [Rhodospirillaceae bacterium]
MLDTIIKGGLVVDGSGQPGRVADVGLEGDRIAAVGDLKDATAGETVDATGLVVAPGFIDLHTHSDFSLLVNGAAESQVHQGVTFEVVGNCGHSCAPVVDAEAVKHAIFGHRDCVPIDWHGFGQYLDRLEAQALGVNVAALVGHGTIRLNVLGGAQRAASPDEVTAMERLLDGALEEGAIGFTTGLEYSPGNSARVEEILALCQVAGKHDVMYATHVRNRDYFYEQGFGEALAMARRAGVKLQISHITPKFGAPPHATEHTMEMIRWTRETGADVGFDMIPHEWGPTTMTAVLPPWAFEGGVTKLLDRLRDPETRERLKQNPLPIWKLVPAGHWDKLVLFQSQENADLTGLTFAEIGRRRGVHPYDAILDLLLEEGEGLYNVTWVGELVSTSDLLMTMHEPDCGLISDTITLAPYGELGDVKWAPSSYGWTARVLGRYVRDEGVFTLEEAVHRITALPASRLGLSDRGALREGAFADVTVFDAGTITDLSDLKAPNIYPSGIRHVLVNGRFAMRDGERTPVNAGRVVRRH